MSNRGTVAWAVAVAVVCVLPGFARAETAGLVTLKLRTGEELTGTPEPTAVVLQLAYGELRIPLANIETLRRVVADKPSSVQVMASVQVMTSEKIEGQITAPDAIALKTEFGTLTIPLSRIALLQRARPERADVRADVRADRISVPNARHVDAVYIEPARRDEVIVFTENRGSFCGGGTPAAVWRVKFAPGGDGPPQLTPVSHTLNLIQQVRGTVFRASDGTLFTGGGWGGPTPPYYCTDGGITWRAANAGGHPPNSTFSFCEFKGQVYAGTGYEPHHGGVYRWLGDGKWEHVLDVPPPRSIVPSLAAFDNRMFVAAELYWADMAKGGGTPVYVSADGKKFTATTGIPEMWSIYKLVVVGGHLLAFGAGPAEKGSTSKVYLWDDEQWRPLVDFPLPDGSRLVTAAGSLLYTCGRWEGKGVPGLYVSLDQAKTWRRLGDLPAEARCLAVSGDVAYIGLCGSDTKLGEVMRIEVGPLVSRTITP